MSARARRTLFLGGTVSGRHGVWELARLWFLGVIQPDQPPWGHHEGRGQRPLWQSWDGRENLGNLKGVGMGVVGERCCTWCGPAEP